MLSINDLSFRYPGGVLALSDVTVSFPHEHILAILGESGSGKTTLLQCIGRFLRPTSGNIMLDGKNIFDLPEQAFRRELGIVFQDLNLFPHLTVLENMTLAPTKVLGMQAGAAKKEARLILERFGLRELIESYPAQISGGQAQRVAISRALMLKPTYLLLDEPTSALDVYTTESFADWLKELRAETTFIVVTHDTVFAKRVASSGIFIDKGQMKGTGSITDIVGYFRDTES